MELQQFTALNARRSGTVFDPVRYGRSGTVRYGYGRTGHVIRYGTAGPEKPGPVDPGTGDVQYCRLFPRRVVVSYHI